MTTIYWKPLDLTKIAPGQKLDKAGSDLTALASAHDRWVHNFYEPCLFSFTSTQQDINPTDIGLSTNANSAEELAQLVVRNNTQRHPIKVSMLALVTSAGTTGTLTINHGGASATASVTATSATIVTATVTPTTGSSPLALKITGHTDSGHSVVLVSASATLAPADRTTGGSGTDGYIPLYDIPSNVAVSTEWVGRGYNNMRALAIDRVTCLATTVHAMNVVNRGGSYYNITTTPKLLGRLFVLPCENQTRDGAVSFRMDVGTSVTGKVQLLVGPGQSTTHDITASGWTHVDIEIPKDGVAVQLYGQCDVGSTGDFSLTTMQVFRRS